MVASYQSSLCDEWGNERADFGLAAVLGMGYRGTFDAEGDGGSIYMLHGELARAVGTALAVRFERVQLGGVRLGEQVFRAHELVDQEDARVFLTTREFQLLSALVEHAPRVAGPGPARLR